MIIETNRLILRDMTEDDFGALYKVWGDADNMKYYSTIFDEKLVRLWISRSIEKYKIFGFGLMVVCLKESGEVIGDCGLTMQIINKQIKPEIGYHIRADKHRMGYAKEAAIAVRDWVFKNTTFQTIYSYMSYDNEASARTAMAYGCKQVEEYIDEANEKTKVFAITKEEWLNL